MKVLREMFIKEKYIPSIEKLFELSIFSESLFKNLKITRKCSII